MIHPHLWAAVAGAVVGLPLLALAARALQRAWPRLERRGRGLLATGLALFGAAYALNVYAWLIEPNALFVRRVEIESTAWNGPPITIAALGDVHIAGPHVALARVSRLVERVNALDADVIVLLGDYVAGHEVKDARGVAERAEIARGLTMLEALDAPLGVVAVIGNHDVWYDRETVVRELEAAGITVLWNRHAAIVRADHQFTLAGLADATTGTPDLASALDGAPVGSDRIVLAHSPDPFVDVPPGEALILAAHTHCGQVWVPFAGRPIVPSRYGQRFACGLVEEEGRRMLVTAGIGTSILPVRFLTPPEILFITLRGASPG